MTQLTYGDHTIDPATLPETSLHALLHEGFTHYLGNRVASKVSVWCDAQAGEGEDSKTWKVANAEAVSAKAAEFRADMIAKLIAGTIGERSLRGPSASADPLAAEMRKIAKAQITAILVASGMKFPTKDSTISLKGQAFTGDELVANRLNPEYAKNNREAIEREAKRNLDARKREAAKMAEAGVDSL